MPPGARLRPPLKVEDVPLSTTTGVMPEGGVYLGENTFVGDKPHVPAASTGTLSRAAVFRV